MRLNKINLLSYEEKYKDFLKIIDNDNKNHYVKQIDERLLLGNNSNNFMLDSGYLVEIDNKIVGYVYFSSIVNYKMYIEYLILNNYRRKGYGKLLLEECTNFILENYNIKKILLDIDKSNLASMNTAISCGFYYDENSLINNSSRIEFSLDNVYFIDKRKK